ncbi:MAG: dehydrogenase, partial [Candidatus Omnitrophica bacterium]|nr:dehydrogenase [Candidatus Omnitrophota bacterium]
MILHTLIARKRILVGLGLTISSWALAQGYGPEVAASKMTVPEGFEVKLFASEPEIRQPVAMEFDHRGRLWVIQYLQYPNPAGLERVEVDRWSRTTYDRVPEPPPKGPRGADRITICEDTDGDGVADSFKDFVDGLNLASGLAFGHGGVFVLQVPYLLFYPDKNHDDIPDSDPEVCLTGFGMQDAHSVANSLTFGPDGWLYGNQGSTVTAHIRGIEFQQGVWRYHPVTKEFELFCEGGGNMWGLDFNEWGDLFSSTNVGPALCLHGVQGGYYWKSFGKHGDLHNPYAYGYFDHMKEANYVGGHVTVGGSFYRGPSFPEEYIGKYIGGNLLSHDVYWHVIESDGSTYQARHGGELAVSNDAWCAPTDVTIGPDGAVYFSDWNDQRTAHPDPDADWDRTNGRVYRIQVKDAAPVPVDLSEKSNNELIDLLGSQNQWMVRHARSILTERRDPSIQSTLKEMIGRPSDSNTQLEALWTLYSCGGMTDDLADSLLLHLKPEVRRWVVHFLGDAREVPQSSGERLVQMARTEADVRVRSQLASTAKRIQSEFGLRIVKEIVARDEDGGDPHVPLLIWWALEAHSVSSQHLAMELLTQEDVWNSSLFQKEILPRLMRRYAAEGTEETDEACFALLNRADDPTPLLESLGEGWGDRGRKIRGMEGGSLFTSYAASNLEAVNEEDSSIRISGDLRNELKTLLEADPKNPQLLTLLCKAGDPDSLNRVREWAFDSDSTDDHRKVSLKILSEVQDSESREQFLSQLSTETSPEFFEPLLEGVRRTARDEDAGALLTLYREAPVDRQSKILEVILSKEAFALAFLKKVEAGE